jgi:hypothetical protein
MGVLGRAESSTQAFATPESIQGKKTEFLVNNINLAREERIAVSALADSKKFSQSESIKFAPAVIKNNYSDFFIAAEEIAKAKFSKLSDQEAYLNSMEKSWKMARSIYTEQTLSEKRTTTIKQAKNGDVEGAIKTANEAKSIIGNQSLFEKWMQVTSKQALSEGVSAAFINQVCIGLGFNDNFIQQIMSNVASNDQSFAQMVDANKQLRAASLEASKTTDDYVEDLRETSQEPDGKEEKDTSYEAAKKKALKKVFKKA